MFLFHYVYFSGKYASMGGFPNENNKTSFDITVRHFFRIVSTTLYEFHMQQFARNMCKMLLVVPDIVEANGQMY